MTRLKDLLSAVNSNVVKEHLDVCDAGRRGQTLAGTRIVGGTDSVPGLHPWIGAIIKENVKINFYFSPKPDCN